MSRTVHTGTAIARDPRVATGKRPTLSDTAATLLPGLQQAHSFLEVAIRVLQNVGGNLSPQGEDVTAEAARVRQLLTAFARVEKRR